MSIRHLNELVHGAYRTETAQRRMEQFGDKSDKMCLTKTVWTKLDLKLKRRKRKLSLTLSILWPIRTRHGLKILKFWGPPTRHVSGWDVRNPKLHKNRNDIIWQHHVTESESFSQSATIYITKERKKAEKLFLCHVFRLKFAEIFTIKFVRSITKRDSVWLACTYALILSRNRMLLPGFGGTL